MIQLRDGSLLERYGFIHEMYQRVLYLGVPQPRRVALHRRIGVFQETAYADHLPEIAAELSVHFGEGRDYLRAVRYRRLSAANAVKLYANREAIEHLNLAVTLLAHIPAGERAALEVALLDERGIAHRMMDDNAAAAADFQRAVDCARQAGRTDWEVRALLRFSAVLFWTNQDQSLAIAERAVELSRSLPDPYLHLQALGYCATRRIRLRGWSDADFQSCVAAANAARQIGDRVFLGVHTMSCSFFQSYRSREREACRAADEGLQIALETNDSFLYISCQYFKAWALLHRGEWGEALEIVRDGLRLAESSGHGTAVVVLRMIEARLRIHARDFQGARELSQLALSGAREGFPRLITLVGLGEAFLACGSTTLHSIVLRRSQGPPNGTAFDWTGSSISRSIVLAASSGSNGVNSPAPGRMPCASANWPPNPGSGPTWHSAGFCSPRSPWRKMIWRKPARSWRMRACSSKMANRPWRNGASLPPPRIWPVPPACSRGLRLPCPPMSPSAGCRCFSHRPAELPFNRFLTAA